MDAARSAWRSGASPVTVVYRRGRAEMPAQVEEIEAAEREGIVIRTGLAPVEVVSRDGAVVGIRCTETAPADLPAAPAPAPTPRHLGPRSRDRPGAPGQDDPGRRRRGARPVDPARGRRHRGQRLGRHRRRSPDAGHRPGRHLRRRRRRVRAEDDHRRGRLGPAGRGIHPRVPRRRRRRRGARSSRRSATGRRAKPRSPSTCRRGRAPTRRCRSSSRARSRRPRSGSTSGPRGPRPAAASAATRSTPGPRVDVTAGRGPGPSRRRSPHHRPATPDIAGGTL